MFWPFVHALWGQMGSVGQCLTMMVIDTVRLVETIRLDFPMLFG
jgi:hypothetical protein